MTKVYDLKIQVTMHDGKILSANVNEVNVDWKTGDVRIIDCVVDDDKENVWLSFKENVEG